MSSLVLTRPPPLLLLLLALFPPLLRLLRRVLIVFVGWLLRGRLRVMLLSLPSWLRLLGPPPLCSPPFKNTKNLFIHIAHYPVRRFLRDIPTFLKCPLHSLVGEGVGSDR